MADAVGFHCTSRLGGDVVASAPLKRRGVTEKTFLFLQYAALKHGHIDSLQEEIILYPTDSFYL